MSNYWKFLNYFLSFFIAVILSFSACSAQEKLTPDEQETYYNKAYNSQFGGLEGISDEDAVELFKKAAEAGHAPSQWHLGRMYAIGKGVNKDKDQEIFWKEKAAEQGYLNAELDMAEAYMFGEGVEQNHKKAVSYLKSAAEKGHPKAYVLLTPYYTRGLEVAKNIDLAKSYIAKANKIYRSHEVPESLFKYSNPIGISSIDTFDTLVRLQMILSGFDEKAAENGDPKAQHLGAALLLGNKKKQEEGFNWAWASAQSGLLDGQIILGLYAQLSQNDLIRKKKIDVYVACSLAEKELLSKMNSISKSTAKLKTVKECINKVRPLMNNTDVQNATIKINDPAYFQYRKVEDNFLKIEQ